MKKVLFTLAAIMTVTMLNAQEKTFHISPKVGIGSATFTNTEEGAKSTYMTWLIGAQSNFKIQKDVSIGLDVYYTRFGGENDDKMIYMYNDYVNIPLYVRYFIPSGGLNFQIGPELGVLAKSEVDGNVADFVWKDINFSANIGAGYWFQNNLNIDLRYNPGIINVNKIVETKTNLISLSLGYWF